MSLKKFKQFQLADASNIKGGFRFVTKDTGKFVNKVVELRMQGKETSIAVHAGEYCVEW